MNIPNWVWMLAAAGGAYALYQWLGTLNPATVAAAITTTPVVPSSTTAAQLQMLAAYNLPVDATPSGTYPPDDQCSVVNPAQSGYNPVPGAPFYSPSLAQYICGPQSLWQQMSGNGLSGIPRQLIHRRALA